LRLPVLGQHPSLERHQRQRGRHHENDQFATFFAALSIFPLRPVAPFNLKKWISSPPSKSFMYALISGFINLPAYAAAAVRSRRVAALFGPTLIFELFVPLLPLLPLPPPPPPPIALPSFVESNLNSLPLSILNSGASHFRPSLPRGGRRPSAPRHAMCGALKTRQGCLQATMLRRGRSGRLVAHDGRHRQTADAADIVAVSGRGQRLVLGCRCHPRRQAAGAVADVLADVSITDRKLRRNSTKRFPTLGRDLQPKTS
jgi:hypothetical protein